MIEISCYVLDMSTETDGQLMSTHGELRGIGMNSNRYALQEARRHSGYEAADGLFTLQIVSPD